MRKVLLGFTPLVFTLVACSQSTPKPATTPAVSAHPAAAPEITPPANPITDPQVKELMALTGTDKIKEQLTQYIMRNIQQAPFMPKDVIEDMHVSLAKADVNGAAASTYKKYLSTEDAGNIIAFYKTPAGKDLVKATPQIMSEVEHNAMQTGQQVAREVIERHRPEIEAAQKAYQAQHAPPSLNTPAPGAKPSAPAPKATTPNG